MPIFNFRNGRDDNDVTQIEAPCLNDAMYQYLDNIGISVTIESSRSNQKEIDLVKDRNCLLYIINLLGKNSGLTREEILDRLSDIEKNLD